VLIERLRALALQDTAQVDTLRIKLLKVAKPSLPDWPSG
jgi:hypothetical protein